MLIGIVGKPSAGKSSFLNALTKSEIAKTGNYPFTTVKPNVGVGFAFRDCVCKELNIYCQLCLEQSRLRPIPIRIIDVAGLVPGAHEGKGLGNQFLSDLGQADLLIHVVDCSGSLNEEGEDVEPGSHDPLKDIYFLNEEIVRWIQGIIEKGWDKIIRTARSTKTPLQDILYERLSGLKISKQHIKKVLTDRDLSFPVKLEDWNSEVTYKFAIEIRKISKPFIYVCNKIDRPKAEENYKEIKTKFQDEKVIPCSALAELALQKFDKEKKISYSPLEGQIEILNPSENEKNMILKIQKEILEKYGTTGVPNVLTHAIDMLNYITVYPVADISHFTDQDGKVLPDVHLIPKGISAKEFAGKIHKDLMDNFVCGIDARTHKKLSDNYEMRDRDIIKIMSSK